MNRRRVLLADDHPQFAETAAEFLKPMFDVLEIVNDGESLVQETLRLGPDILITDISMPRLDGIKAVHRLRQLGSGAAIVFLTVHLENEFVVACLNAGGLGYVHKSQIKMHLIPAMEAAVVGRSYVALARSH